MQRVPHVRGSVLAVLLFVYVRVGKRAALAWRKFPHLSLFSTCPFTFSPLLSDLPPSRAGDTWEQYCGQSVFPGLFLSVSEAPAMLAGCSFTFYSLRARNNCGSRRAHLAFRSVIWIRGNAFPYCDEQHTLTRNLFLKYISTLLNLSERCFRCVEYIIIAAVLKLRQMSSLHFFNKLISIRRGIYEMELH